MACKGVGGFNGARSVACKGVGGFNGARGVACKGVGGFNGARGVVCKGVGGFNGARSVVCKGVAGFKVAPSSRAMREKVRPARPGVGVSAKKFAQRAQNGPKSVFYGVLGEVFRGTAAG